MKIIQIIKFGEGIVALTNNGKIYHGSPTGELLGDVFYNGTITGHMRWIEVDWERTKLKFSREKRWVHAIKCFFKKLK